MGPRRGPFSFPGPPPAPQEEHSLEEVQVQSAPPAPADTTVLTDAAASQPENGDSEGSQPPSLEEQNAYVNQVFRQVGRAITTSKPSAAEPSGESAPQGDVKPDEGQPARDPMGRFIPRRGVPEAVRTAEQRAADLERQLAERDPVKIREQAIADFKAEQAAAAESAKLDEIAQTQAATVQRYRTLLEVPDHEISPEDYQWREDYKEKLRQYPEVQQHFQTEAQLQVQQERDAFLGVQRQQLQSVASLPGVDAAQIKKLADYGEIGRHLYEAGKAQGEAPLRTRIAELENELTQYRVSGSRGLGAQREPVPAGRSGGGAPPLNENTYMNNLFRGAQRAG